MKLVTFALVAVALLALPSAASAAALDIVPLGRTAAAGAAGAEIAAFDAKTRRAFATNPGANTLDIFDFSNPSAPTLVRSVDLSPYGGAPNSVDVSRKRGGLVAVAMQADVKTDPGQVAFFDTDGRPQGSVPVGSEPDMLTFTPDDKTLLVANEAEPNDSYTVDPVGSVTVINVQRGVKNARVRTATFDGVPFDVPVRIFGPGASPQQDLEPEYIATSDGRTAYVTLQENNAVAILDIDGARFEVVRGLGYKDHSLAANALDVTDKDLSVDIQPFANVFGIYEPDAIAAYSAGGRTYLVTGNEGDEREWGSYKEGARAGKLALDPTAFPAATAAKLARLNVTKTMGDTDGDGDYDKLYAFGGRSLSVLDANARLSFDSGSQLETISSQLDPLNFNKDSSAGSPIDDRSDNKGPEPEGVAVGKVDGHTYAFVATEEVVRGLVEL